MTPKEKNYENLADTLIEKFSRRGIEAYYTTTNEEAVTTAVRFLTPGCSVSWGGSETLKEIGLMNALHTTDCVLYDRTTAQTPEEQKELYGKIATCDFYFMSSNAITLDGQLVNIDGRGNRLAPFIYGPDNVIIIAGMNKVCTDVESAVKRVRNMAAPANVVRLDMKTPCAQTGKCGDCLSPECICSHLVVTRRAHIPGRIKVILVGKELGY